MTLFQAFDVWGRVTKQRLPLRYTRAESCERPAIFGGGWDVVRAERATFCAGDYSTWPVEPVAVVIGHAPIRIDPVEFALESHYSDGPDRDAHLPSGKVRQRRSRDPRTDRNLKVPEDALAVHAAVSLALEASNVPGPVLVTLVKWFPRDLADKAHTYCNHKDRAAARRWLEENEIASKTGFRLGSQK